MSAVFLFWCRFPLLRRQAQSFRYTENAIKSDLQPTTRTEQMTTAKTLSLSHSVKSTYIHMYLYMYVCMYM